MLNVLSKVQKIVLLIIVILAIIGCGSAIYFYKRTQKFKELSKDWQENYYNSNTKTKYYKSKYDNAVSRVKSFRVGYRELEKQNRNLSRELQSVKKAAHNLRVKYKDLQEMYDIQVSGKGKGEAEREPIRPDTIVKTEQYKLCNFKLRIHDSLLKMDIKHTMDSIPYHYTVTPQIKIVKYKKRQCPEGWFSGFVCKILPFFWGKEQRLDAFCVQDNCKVQANYIEIKK
jgi:uncharacterized lipoprotein YehR (DUF1307 family)